MVKSYSKRVFELIMRPEMKILPGHLAFFLILSIFPLLTLLGYIISNINILSVPASSILEHLIPSNISNLIVPFFKDRNFSGNMTFIMIVGFILVSNGTYSIITISNEIYGIISNDEIKKRVKALFMIFILLFLFLFVIVFLAYGNNIINYIINLKVFYNVRNEIYLAFVFIKWPCAFALIFAILKVLYTIAPDEEIPTKYMNKGTFFTTVGWIITTFIYSFYVGSFADYSLFYGNLSNIIVMMIWIYILSFIFVLGMAINAEEYLAYKERYKNKKKVNHK